MAATRITVMNNGSLRVEGDFEIVDQEGKSYGLAGRTRVSLCRCGQSNNKPFCDSSHKTCGFEAIAIAFDLPAPQPKPTTGG
jgi:CDGSH-type Zn-finger protein